MSEDPSDRRVAFVLAAGLGTRMRSRTCKVLHQAAGKPLLSHVIDLLAEVGARPVVVLSRESEPARAVVPEGVPVALQEPPRGTGDAVRVALEAAPGASGTGFIVYGDTVLVRPETLERLAGELAARRAVLTILTGLVGSDNEYGRIVRGSGGDVDRIVEARLATEAERAIPESNFGAYAADIGWLRTAVAQLRPNATGEIFLTDLVKAARDEGRTVAALCVADASEGLGVNTRADLAVVDGILRERLRQRHMAAGVTFIDPASSSVDATVEIAADAVIDRGSILEGRTRVGRDSRIGPYSIVRDTVIGERCRVEASVLESATLEDDVRIGPFSHLRPGAYLERGVEMGNFNEVKASRLGTGTKMHHFGYIGDASVGQRVNIGAGTITMNYTAKRTKERTEIGDDAFIGSDTLLRAPIKVGKGAITGGGSVVTKDVPDGTVAVGMPARAIKRADQPAKKGT